MHKKLYLITSLLASAMIQQVSAQVIFSDDFESGLGNWTTTGSSALTLDLAHNVVPSSGTSSAYLNTSTDRMHNNIIADNGGVELGGHSTFTSYIYDEAGTASRIFNEVRGYSLTGLPDGGTAAAGTLSQLLAIGKYNTITVGSAWDVTKYQARVVTGGAVGWFNLDGVGAPSRSVGWHRFDIERLGDGTTINFYVDGILSKTYNGAASATWDTIVMGPGLGTTVGDGWIDGISVNVGAPLPVPEPSTLALGLIGGILAMGYINRRAKK